MVNNFSDIIGSALSILNTYITDEYNGTRTGSYFFHADQEINFTRYMPKGQVTEDTTELDNKGFGRPPDRDETYRIHVHFFTKHGDTGASTNYKNRELCSYYISDIRKKILTYSGSFGCIDLSFDTVERPIYLPDQKVYVGTLPIIFRARKNGS